MVQMACLDVWEVTIGSLYIPNPPHSLFDTFLVRSALRFHFEKQKLSQTGRRQKSDLQCDKYVTLILRECPQTSLVRVFQ